jgi:hypothetical protein
MDDDRWIGKVLERGGHDLFQDTIPLFTCEYWELWSRPGKIVGDSAKIRTAHLPNTVPGLYRYTSLLEREEGENPLSPYVSRFESRNATS